MDPQLLYFIMLVIITLALYLLPFIPACYEWKYKTDAEPFLVAFQDRTTVDYTIRLFKADLIARFSAIINAHSAIPSMLVSQACDEPYYITGKSQLLELKGQDVVDQKTNNAVLFTHDGVLPNDCTFTNKIYACGELYIGKNNRLSEVYSEKSVVIKSNSHVDKLIYAGSNIIVEPDVILHCYTKALNKITLFAPAKFQYLHAPLIEFSPVTTNHYLETLDVIGMNIPRMVMEYNFILRAYHHKLMHFVVKGSLTIEHDCKIVGNIKAYQGLIIGDNSTILGAIFSCGTVNIGNNCVIQGPIVTNGSLVIGKSCKIGSIDGLTSIVADRINIAENCCISGQVLAKVQGTFH